MYLLDIFFQSFRTGLPNVSYVKCIDIWMFACLTFVIFALVEFSVVIKIGTVEKSIKDKRKEIKERRKRNCIRCRDLPTELQGVRQLAMNEENSNEKVDGNADSNHVLPKCSCEDGYTEVVYLDWVNWEKLGGRVDRASIAIIPTAFFIFNIAYWITYYSS